MFLKSKQYRIVSKTIIHIWKSLSFSLLNSDLKKIKLKEEKVAKDRALGNIGRGYDMKNRQRKWGIPEDRNVTKNQKGKYLGKGD